MTLFHFKKEKKTEKAQECACTCSAASQQPCACENGKQGIRIKVLGSGCKSCHQLYENAKQAVSNLGSLEEVEYVTDMSKIMQYGVMRMPALVIDENVASMGRVLSPKEVEGLLRKAGI